MASPIPNIVVIGSINTDLVTRTSRIPGPGETLTAKSFTTGFGGKGANQAVACARLSRSKPRPGQSPTTEPALPSYQNLESSQSSLGDASAHSGAFQGARASVSMIGNVGADSYGDSFLMHLKSEDIGCGGIRRDERESTGTAVILVEEDTGENRILLAPGANYGLGLDDAISRVKKWEDGGGHGDVVVLQLEIKLDVVIGLMEYFAGQNTNVVLNPAPAQPLPDSIYKKLKHLIMNETETAILAGLQPEEVNVHADLSSIANKFIAKGVQNVIITLGSHGVFYHTHTMSSHNLHGHLVPARRVPVLDTTAAGDTFVGAYTICVAEHAFARSPAAKQQSDVRGEERSVNSAEGCEFEVGKAVEFANRAASVTVQRRGAQAAIPWADEV